MSIFASFLGKALIGITGTLGPLGIGLSIYKNNSPQEKQKTQSNFNFEKEGENLIYTKTTTITKQIGSELKASSDNLYKCRLKDAAGGKLIIEDKQCSFENKTDVKKDTDDKYFFYSSKERKDAITKETLKTADNIVPIKVSFDLMKKILWNEQQVIEIVAIDAADDSTDRFAIIIPLFGKNGSKTLSSFNYFLFKAEMTETSIEKNTDETDKYSCLVNGEKDEKTCKVYKFSSSEEDTYKEKTFINKLEETDKLTKDKYYLLEMSNYYYYNGKESLRLKEIVIKGKDDKKSSKITTFFPSTINTTHDKKSYLLTLDN